MSDCYCSWAVRAGRDGVGGAFVKLGPITFAWGRWFGPLWIEAHYMNRLVRRWISLDAAARPA